MSCPGRQVVEWQDGRRCYCGADLDRHSLYVRPAGPDGPRFGYCSTHSKPAPRSPKLTDDQQIDALAGQRQAITEGKDSLLWPPSDEPPVSKGQEFELRSLRIRITKLETIRTQGSHWGWWRAEFVRIVEDSGLFHGRHGSTTDPRMAMKAQDDPEAATLDRISDLERSESQRRAGDEPEPQGVYREDLERFTLDSLRRAEELKAAKRQEHEERPLSERLRSIESDPDVQRQLRVIEDRINAAERKLQRSGKVPSDRAA